MENILRVQVNVFCLLIVAILWFSGDRRKTSKSDIDVRLYRAMLISTAVMLFLDALTWLFDGMSGEWGRNAVLTANTLYFVFHALPLPISILYTDFQLFRDEKRMRKFVYPLSLVAGSIVVAALFSPFAEILFYVDRSNHYVRGAWFPAFAATQFCLAAYLLAHVVHNRKKVNRRIFIALLAYPAPMLLASILQTLVFGLVLIWPTMSLSLIAIAFNLENRRAKTDYLTGTANRRTLDEELERRIDLCKSGKSLSGLMLDIDDFKSINDLFGHEAGDRALEDVANILLSSVRVDDHVARMGGDEFVILLDFKEPEAIERLGKRIETAIENLNSSKQRPYQISMSIGRSIYEREGGGKASDFLAILDADMYASKTKKKSNV